MIVIALIHKVGIQPYKILESDIIDTDLATAKMYVKQKNEDVLKELIEHLQKNEKDDPVIAYQAKMFQRDGLEAKFNGSMIYPYRYQIINQNVHHNVTSFDGKELRILPL